MGYHITASRVAYQMHTSLYQHACVALSVSTPLMMNFDPHLGYRRNNISRKTGGTLVVELTYCETYLTPSLPSDANPREGAKNHHGGGACSSVAVVSRFTVDHATLLRRGTPFLLFLATPPTFCRSLRFFRILLVHKSVCQSFPVLFRRLWISSVS